MIDQSSAILLFHPPVCKDPALYMDGWKRKNGLERSARL